jgi:F-type H+-transporting ATPase subunit b
MKPSRRILSVTSVFFLLLLAAVDARAAQEGGNTAAGQSIEIFKWINFVIVAGAIFWVFGKFLPPKFRANAETIGAAISRATATKAEADGALKVAERKLADLEKEVAELRALAERESAAEAERIRAATQADGLKISVAAKAEIEAAERAARMELRAIAAKLAVDGAESLLVRQLTPAAQETLIGNFVKSLEGRPN